MSPDTEVTGAGGVTHCGALENVPFPFQVDTGVAAPGPGQVESRGQKGQEHGCPQEGGHDKARVPSAQLKCSFIKRLPKKRLPA